MNLFGKSKKAAKSDITPKDAIVKLREMLSVLEKKEKFLQTKIDHETTIASQNALKNKRIALMALKKRKQYIHEMDKITGTMSTLEAQVMAIENANVNLEALRAMKSGADAMKAIHGSINIDRVDETMDDIREQMDIANEVSNAISQPVGFGLEFDEDELAAELDALEQEQLDAKLLDSTSVKNLPELQVSKTREQLSPLQEEQELDKELEELKASMAT